MQALTPKGTLLGILLSLIAALSSVGIFVLYQKVQPLETNKTAPSEVVQPVAPAP